MRIFFITNTIGDYGGSEVMTRNLLSQLIKQGHKLFIFTSCDYKLPGAETYIAPHFGHHALHKLQVLFSIHRAVALAKKFNPDVIHSHSNSFMGIIGHRIKCVSGVPHVYTIEMLSPETASLHGKAIFLSEKFLIPRLNFDALTCWSAMPFSQFLLPWGIPKEKLHVIPPALDMKNYNLRATGKKFTSRYGKNLITSLKNLAGLNTKALMQVIDAMPAVREKHPDYKYVIFGGGQGKPALENYVREKGLQDFVLFGGNVSQQECNDVWAVTSVAPHVFVFDVTIGISFLEYLAFGVPCVVTDVGDVKNLVGDAALFVPRNNTRALADAINSLIENPAKRKILSTKARTVVANKFSLEAVAKNLVKIYNGVLM
ncbi:MAG: glycosyltransferase family 4 protein [Candidatus Diapherotrites archaeon]